jgi:glycosyltransferase involved in cell wall biosynthesis
VRVVRISEYVTPSPGGKEVHVLELSLSQARRGRSVCLMYRVGESAGWPFDAKRLLGCKRFWQRFPDHFVSTCFLAAILAAIVRERRTIDLAHFHGDYREAVVAGAVRLLGTPSLLTLHGRLSSRVLRRAGLAYRLPSHIVAVSPAIVAQLEDIGIPRRKMTIQSSGVDPALFFPAKEVPDASPLRLIVGSALIKLKDHATLFEAVRLLQAEGLDVRIEVAGSGPERGRLERIAPGGTRFHGHLERAVLADLMRSCHLAVLSSIDTRDSGEGTPTFLLEAMACGLPFVATASGGIPQLGARSGAGLVVEQRRPDEVAAGVRRVVLDRARYESHRRAALAFAKSVQWDRVARRLDCLMESLVRADNHHCHESAVDD